MTALSANRRGERGAALVVSLLIMAVLALLGAAMIAGSVVDLKISGNQRASKVDFYAADGGTRLLINRLSAAGDQVGNVVNPDLPGVQQLVPGAANPAEPEDAAMPGWALVQQGATPAWAAQPVPFSYHYRIFFLRKSNPPKGYSASAFAGFYYEVDCVAGNTGVSTVNMKIGPK